MYAWVIFDYNINVTLLTIMHEEIENITRMAASCTIITQTE